MNLKRGPRRGLQQTVSVAGRGGEAADFVSGAFELQYEDGEAGSLSAHTSIPVYEATRSNRVQRIAFDTLLAADLTISHIVGHVNALKHKTEIVDQSLTKELDWDRKEHLATSVTDCRYALTNPFPGAGIIADTLLRFLLRIHRTRRRY